ncbi:MAG: UDP-N-acetylmuramoyl-L-alanyl-D-glutamate--2,6-diaminopimelate ligase [Planctomycetota bacterium]|nr:UDP-N-acetylmuramoyl-L-alanyl-D-glutamate--2,6-diaminopimelate ligase [Planctomycetota bacterium]
MAPVELAVLAERLGGSLAPVGGAGPRITGVHLDSRRVSVGDLFAAVSGGIEESERYAREAVKRGASAVLARRAFEVGVPVWVHEHARLAAGLAAALVAGEPSKRMFTCGITGTNGKTTTAHLLYQLLVKAGRKPAVLGTAGHRLADGLARVASHTTPDAPEIQRLLAAHRDMGGDALSMEVSSHALDQERTAGIAFDVAIFTNLTRDHLDYHKDFESYTAAKERLFSGLSAKSTAVLNADDPASERLGRAARRAGARVLTYSTQSNGDLCASDIRTDLGGTDFVLNGMGISRTKIRVPLAGRYNVANALAAAASVLVSGASPSIVMDGLATASAAPGRLEPVSSNGRGFAVLVDYAHSEDALSNVCRVLKQSLAMRTSNTGRLIVVFGCGGDRDKGKRAPMGRVVSELADLAIVTSDNPRSEDPERIIAEIVMGMKTDGAERSTFIVESDRRRAIHAAVSHARVGDVVLIAGKGHETTQTIGTQVLEFDDRVVAGEALR